MNNLPNLNSMPKEIVGIIGDFAGKEARKNMALSTKRVHAGVRYYQSPEASFKIEDGRLNHLVSFPMAKLSHMTFKVIPQGSTSYRNIAELFRNLEPGSAGVQICHQEIMRDANALSNATRQNFSWTYTPPEMEIATTEASRPPEIYILRGDRLDDTTIELARRSVAFAREWAGKKTSSTVSPLSASSPAKFLKFENEFFFGGIEDARVIIETALERNPTPEQKAELLALREKVEQLRIKFPLLKKRVNRSVTHTSGIGAGVLESAVRSILR